MKTSGSNVKSRTAASGVVPAEIGLLFVLATVPSLFVLGLDTPFEPPKAVVVWVAASLVLAIAAWSAVSRVRELVLDRPLIPLFVGACLWVAGALALSVWVSDAPALGWWGSGLRRFGGATELALLAVMLATSILIRDAGRLSRVCAAAAVGSIIPTVVALAQWIGFDPFDAQALRWARPGSTFGNPLILAGYLVTVLPLTVARAIRSGRGWGRAWWALGALQAIAFVAARSVGPFVALLAASLITGAILFASHRRRIPAVAISSVMALAAVAALLAGPRLVKAAMAMPTVRFRVLLWRAAGAAIEAEPGRLILGSGPESITRSLIRYADTSVRNIEGQNVVPDRAHNQTLDTTLAFGGVGLAARLTIEYLALAAAFSVFGLLPSSERRRFAALAAVVNACAVGGAWVFSGAWALALSVPIAFVLVASLWIVRSASRSDISPNRDWTALVAGATVAWLAHDFEVQTGVATISSAMIAAVALGGTVGAAAARGTRVANRSPGWVSASILAAIVGAAVSMGIADGMVNTNDLALANEADVLARQAAAAGDRRDALMRAAAGRLERAWVVNPYSYHYARRRASLERQWARNLPPAERAPHLQEADRWYTAALDLAPLLPFLWEEWANLALERGMPAEALQRLERMLELGRPPKEIFDLGDEALGATGVEVTGPAGIEKGVEALRSRGHTRLAELYAGRSRR